MKYRFLFLINTYILEFQNGGKNGRIVLVWW